MCDMLPHRVALRALGAVVLVCAFSACEEDPEQSGPRFPVPTITAPTLPTGQPPPQTPTGQPPLPTSGGSQYNLTTAQATGILQAGYTVIGPLPSGEELRAYKTTTTVYEDQQVTTSKCDYEYDPYTEENEYECHDEIVYEKRPVQKTVFVVATSAFTVEFDEAYEATTRATSLGVTEWRQG